MAATRGQPEVRHTTSNTHVNGQRSPDRSTGKPPSVCPKPAEICANIFNYISLPAWSGKNTRTVFLHFLVCSYFFGMILYINSERVTRHTCIIELEREHAHFRLSQAPDTYNESRLAPIVRIPLQNTSATTQTNMAQGVNERDCNNPKQNPQSLTSLHEHVLHIHMHQQNSEHSTLRNMLFYLAI